jgi:hypothetical protein
MDHSFVQGKANSYRRELAIVLGPITVVKVLWGSIQDYGNQVDILSEERFATNTKTPLRCHMSAQNFWASKAGDFPE